jgi:hypothetical protein
MIEIAPLISPIRAPATAPEHRNFPDKFAVACFDGRFASVSIAVTHLGWKSHESS